MELYKDFEETKEIFEFNICGIYTMYWYILYFSGQISFIKFSCKYGYR